MEIEKASAEDRPMWWIIEERGPRSANASPRGSLTGARSLRRGDFASQRSISGRFVAFCSHLAIRYFNGVGNIQGHIFRFQECLLAFLTYFNCFQNLYLNMKCVAVHSFYALDVACSRTITYIRLQFFLHELIEILFISTN